MNLTPLKTLAEETIRQCTFTQPVTTPHGQREMALLLPSGDGKYPSFWVRDAAMMAESGLVDSARLKDYIVFIAENGQNGENTLLLEHGLEVPPYAVADHINYTGKPVFFPGTYADGSDQGTGDYGFYPPFCDNFYFILIVEAYVRQTGDTAILQKVCNGVTLAHRLEAAFEAYNIDPDTGLCHSDSRRYTVDWGFVDTIRKSGLLAFSSLLRYRAGRALQRLLDHKAATYDAACETIKASLRQHLYDPRTGWLYSATGTGHQHDVWATAYALYLGVLEEEKTFLALKAAYLDGTAVKNGYVRHILTDEDHSPTSAWECTPVELGRYQNGGYWATATGWYARGLYNHDPALGEAMVADFLRHTDAYRVEGSPYEWINTDTTVVDGRHYGTSGVLPYVAFMDLGEE